MLKNLEGDMGEAKLSVSAKQEQQAESLALLEQDMRDVRDGRTISRTRAAGPQGQPSQAWQAGGPMQMTSMPLSQNHTWPGIALGLCAHVPEGLARLKREEG